VDGTFGLTPPPVALKARRRKAQPFVLAPKIEAERQQQIDCTKMLDVVLRPEVCFTAIDHSHSRNPTIGRNGQEIGWSEVARRKAQGVRPGIPDYLFWDQGYAYAIEFKVGEGELSEAEKDFMRKLIGAGVICKVCWGQTQVMNTVYGWHLCRPSVRWEIR
jgi:hypothetical protein